MQRNLLRERLLFKCCRNIPRILLFGNSISQKTDRINAWQHTLTFKTSHIKLEVTAVQKMVMARYGVDLKISVNE